MSKFTVSLLALASAVNAASLGEVKHVVLLMMENRSFQHVSVEILAKYAASVGIHMLIGVVLWYLGRGSRLCRSECSDQSEW
jgi:hypothetical protein